MKPEDQRLKPETGESARAYTERMNAQGIREFVGLERFFGFSEGAAKGMWIASERFNASFSFEQWSNRRNASGDDFGAKNWLKRKYALNDEQAALVSAEFEQGNREGLLKVIDFEGIARRRVVKDYVEEMEEKGAFE